MIQNLGKVRPGRTIRIPFSTFDKDDGSSITMTNYAVADILIYKDGGTTERASTAGFTATTDFDSKTGKHLLIIDLADNTTAGFFAAGGEFLVGIDAVTVDAVTVGGWVARFEIGYDGAIFDTTIATLSSQTSFTLTSGPAEDDALNGMWCLIHDVASAVQFGYAVISDYTGSTKTVTLAAGTTFTVAAGDNFSLMGPMPLQPTVAGRTFDVSSGGEGGIDLANVGSPTTALNLSGLTIKSVTDVESILGALNAAAASGDPGTTTTLTAYLKQLVNVLVGTAGVAAFPAGADPDNGVSLAEVLNKLFDNLALTQSAAQNASGNSDTLILRLTSARAGYLDNLNVGGAVASQADVLALNQSASRRVILVTVGQYERPESGSTTYTVEARTYDDDGAVTNADSTPTLTATGIVSGSLAANLSAASNPETGVYRWTYTVQSNATIEQVRFDVSATMTTAFTLSCYTQVADFVAATFTTADRTKLEAVHGKLPSKAYLTGTDNSDGDVEMDEATGNYPGSVGSINGITFPTNFGALGINVSGHISRVVLVDTITTYTGNTPQSGDAFARMATYRLDQLFTADVTAPVAGSMFGDLTEDNSGTRRFTTAALVNAPSGSGLTAQQARDAMKLAPTAGAAAAGSIDAKLDTLGAVAGIPGPGADECTMTITNSSNGQPVPDADVWVTSDAAGNTVVAGTLQTDSSGDVTFMLDDGETYYLWMQKDGVNSIRGQSFVAEAD